MALAYIFLVSPVEPELHSDSGEWIHLKRGLLPWRTWPNWSTWTLYHALQWDDRLVESQEGLETNVGPKVDLVVLGKRLFGNRALVIDIDYKMPKFDSDDLVVGSEPCPTSSTMALCVSLHSGVKAALICLDSLRLPSCTRNPNIGSKRLEDTLFSHSWPSGRVGGITGKKISKKEEGRGERDGCAYEEARESERRKGRR
ncbi:hypothetical protein M9H77_17624 [Catharanthus roseus]|uniref:Uncharacterized protein n=1 Tax=Catharanthus roseus TaxID=4058 RepID=A0ACC0B541_CATRO|nr:hypothetical protein M9H77_17624 [Catharanthus roseus]